MFAEKKTLKILVIFSLVVLFSFMFFKNDKPQHSDPLVIATKEQAKNSISNKASVENDAKWLNTPRVTLMCRLYAGSALEYFNTFNVGYLMFWPMREWTNSDLVLIFDDENEADHRMGKNRYKMPN